MDSKIKIILLIILGIFVLGFFSFEAKQYSFYDIFFYNTIVKNDLKLNENENEKELCLAKDNSFITKVIDGDTVIAEGGYSIRLIGIDTDEKGYPCYDAAKTRLENLLLGRMVRLEKDTTDIDQYGRCLRYIFIDNDNVNAKMVREGFAVARFYNDVKYKQEIILAENKAKEDKTGCKWIAK